DTRPGSLELRLQPTLSSYNNSAERGDSKKALSLHTGEGHSFRLFRSSGARGLNKKSSQNSLRNASTLRPGIVRSTTGLSSREGASSSMAGDPKKVGRFVLRSKTPSSEEKQASDDLTKMMERASSYMSFAYIRIPPVELC